MTNNTYFNQIINTVSTTVERMCFGGHVHRNNIDEVTSRTYKIILRNWEKFLSDDTLNESTFLFKSISDARADLAKYAKAAKRDVDRCVSMFTDDETDDLDFEAPSTDRQEINDLHKAIARLGRDDRDAVQASLNGTIQQLAKLRGITTEAVHMRVKRAQPKLKALMVA